MGKKQVDGINDGSNLAGLEKTQLKQAIGTVTALPALSTTRKHSCRIIFSCNNAAVDPAGDNVLTTRFLHQSQTMASFQSQFKNAESLLQMIIGKRD
jgi:hypothetical protein